MGSELGSTSRFWPTFDFDFGQVDGDAGEMARLLVGDGAAELGAVLVRVELGH